MTRRGGCGVLLAVDVGNSHTVLAAFEGARLVDQWRVRTQRGATSDELGMTAGVLLGQRGLSLAGVAGLVVGSVVPSLRAAWGELGRRRVGCEVLVVEAGLRTGLRLAVDRPGEVGADRIADGLAAWRLHGAPVIVVDCGTATTVDAISADGRYLGGAIAPGIGVSYEALVASAALLQAVEVGMPARALGANTADQMRSGLIFGCAGQIDALVDRIRAEMGGAELVVATGGWASAIVPASRTIDRCDPLLTVQGLRLIFEACGGAAAPDGPSRSQEEAATAGRTDAHRAAPRSETQPAPSEEVPR